MIHHRRLVLLQRDEAHGRGLEIYVDARRDGGELATNVTGRRLVLRRDCRFRRLERRRLLRALPSELRGAWTRSRTLGRTHSRAADSLD